MTGGLTFTAHRLFDGAGRESTRTGTGLISAATYAYGDDGRKSGETLPLTLCGPIDSGFTYTPDGRLSAVTGSGAGTFGFDSAGNVTTYTASVGSGATTEGVLAYDSRGRLTERMSTTVPTAALENFGFDVAAGWRTSQKRSGEASVTYGYDAAGHLTSYHRPAGARGATVTLDAAYAYDALGQRTVSAVTNGSVTTTTTWTYDGLQLDALSATDTVGARWSITYLYDQEGRPFAGVYRSNTSSSTVFGVLTTDRGDVVGLTAPGGTTFASYRYDAWGRPLTLATQGVDGVSAALASDIASRQPLRYAGYCYDAESGTYYCSARSYDPETMQFLQKDPARADGEESAYQYCGGDPVGKVDPSGLFAVPGSRQVRGSNWCWVAASVSALGFLGHPTSQGVFYDYVKGRGAKRTLGAYDREVKRGIEHFLGRRISLVERPLSLTALKSQINRRWPVIVHLDWRAGGYGHFVVVDAYAGNDFRYMDPGTGKHSELIPYSKLVSSRASTWRSTLYDIGK